MGGGNVYCQLILPAGGAGVVCPSGFAYYKSPTVTTVVKSFGHTNGGKCFFKGTARLNRFQVGESKDANSHTVSHHQPDHPTLIEYKSPCTTLRRNCYVNNNALNLQ